VLRQPPHHLHRARTQPPSPNPASRRRHQREARARRVALPTEHEVIAGGRPRLDLHAHRPSAIDRPPPLAQHESYPQTPQRYTRRESPATTILASPSGCAEGVAPVTARWRGGRRWQREGEGAPPVSPAPRRRERTYVRCLSIAKNVRVICLLDAE
jgi:hypothetical protein